jgi:hypothetical protein
MLSASNFDFLKNLTSNKTEFSKKISFNRKHLRQANHKFCFVWGRRREEIRGQPCFFKRTTFLQFAVILRRSDVEIKFHNNSLTKKNFIFSNSSLILLKKIFDLCAEMLISTEAATLFKRICYKLDALSHTQYTPRKTKDELEVKVILFVSIFFVLCFLSFHSFIKIFQSQIFNELLRFC